MLCASCSAQALCACALRKLVCASCSAPALCKLLCASALSKLLCARALRQLLRASALRMCSVQVGLCKLLCASALCNCSVQVALRKLLCASDSAQVALRKCCRSCGGALRVLRLYLKAAIFKPELWGRAPRTTFVLKSYDSQFLNLEHANLRRGSRAHRRNRKKSSTTRISAEGRARTAEIVKVLSF